jgi:hypothetical protein
VLKKTGRVGDCGGKLFDIDQVGLNDGISIPMLLESLAFEEHIKIRDGFLGDTSIDIAVELKDETPRVPVGSSVPSYQWRPRNLRVGPHL